MYRYIVIFVIVMLVLNMFLFIASVLKGDTTLMARSMFMWLAFLAVGFIITRKHKAEQVKGNDESPAVVSEVKK